MAGELNFREEYLNDSVKIYLSGEIDIYTSQKLKEKLYNMADIAKTDIIVDCKDLIYIDSTGLGVLVGILKRVNQNGKTVYIYNLKENIKKLFTITGLDKLLIIE